MAAAPFNTNLPRATPNYAVPIISGETTAVTGLTSASTQVIGANNSRSKITFHNPNITTNITIFVCQATDKNGNALSAGDGVGGSYTVYPGQDRVFEGDCQMAFNAAAASGSVGLTITESMSR